MRSFRFLLIVLTFAFCAQFALAQQTTTPAMQSSTQVSILLQKSLAALTGGKSVTDATLTGSVRRIAGSDIDNGTGVFRVIASGASRTDLSLQSGLWSETLSSSPTQPSGAWSGPDGVSHPMAYHNLLSCSAWFFPAIPIAQVLSSPGYAVAYIGHEIQNGQSIEHISVSRMSPSAGNISGVTLQHLSRFDLFLDSSSLLPASLTFYMHPDDNALSDIPVEVRFSDYRTVNGGQIPFHIQRFLNDSLVLDFQAVTVTVNTGVSAGTFSVQ